MEGASLTSLTDKPDNEEPTPFSGTKVSQVHFAGNVAVASPRRFKIHCYSSSIPRRAFSTALQYPGAKRGFARRRRKATKPFRTPSEIASEDTQDTKLASDPIRPPVPMQKHGTTVALVGEIPGNLQRDSLGVFNQCAALVNGYPSYAEAGGGRMLWYAQTRWWVGECKDVGKAMGCLSCYFELGSLSETMSPKLVNASWEVWNGELNQWVLAPEVRCIAEEEVASEIATAVNTIALVGNTPHDLQRNCLGVFSKEGGLLNGRPYYAESDGKRMLWFAEGCWYVGLNDGVGKAKGGLSARDGALRPEQVASAWEVWDGSKKAWVTAPGVRYSLICPVTGASYTIVPTGASDQPVLSKHHQGQKKGNPACRRHPCLER